MTLFSKSLLRVPSLLTIIIRPLFLLSCDREKERQARFGFNEGVYAFKKGGFAVALECNPKALKW
jgi:hypothetical protein